MGRGDRIDVERAGLRAFFSFAAQHRRLYRIVGQAEFVDEEVFRRYHERLAEGYVRGLERAMADGQVKKLDPEVLAYALMGMADFLGMRWVLWEEGADVERVVDTVLELLRAGIAVPARGAAAKASKAPRRPSSVRPAKAKVPAKGVVKRAKRGASRVRG
jgi:AcrR family transcriptional regulator